MDNELPIEEIRRRALHEELCSLLGSGYVYFNAPSGLKYPCIRYAISAMDQRYADNILYKHKLCYTLTLIEHDITSDLYLRILEHFQCASFVQKYDADNLHHTVIRLYY